MMKIVRYIVHSIHDVNYFYNNNDRKYYILNNASAITVTIPTSLGDGFNCLLVQKGDGQVTIVAAANVSLFNRSSESKTAGKNAIITLHPYQ